MLVRIAGVEPASLKAQQPKSCVYANSTISAYGVTDGARTRNLLGHNQVLYQLELRPTGTPNGTRTRVAGVKGRCLILLTMGAC